MPVTKANGDRYLITSNGYIAEITEGGSLRLLRHDERDLVTPFPDAAVRPVYRETVLAPWPNRIADSRYTFEGTTHPLPGQRG